MDDLICVGIPKYADPISEKVCNEFDFGAWDDSRTSPTWTYRGKTISKHIALSIGSPSLSSCP